MPTLATNEPATGQPQRSAFNFHWSMRFMSLVSLGVLGIYTYVLFLCRQGRKQAGVAASPVAEERRLRLSTLAFLLDVTISAYFSAATPFILKKGGLPFDRKNMPRPIFWFFAITGFVPTASMTLTVVGGWRWRTRIRAQRGWRIFHGLIALVAYFSWWVACSPLLAMGILGENRTLALLKKSGWLTRLP